MTDEERCKRIAEFEYGPQGETYQRINPADYPHDLNATMRAARKLRDDWLIIDSSGHAWLVDKRSGSARFLHHSTHGAMNDADPARAAFLALSAYLEAKS